MHKNKDKKYSSYRDEKSKEYVEHQIKIDPEDIERYTQEEIYLYCNGYISFQELYFGLDKEQF